MQKKHVNICLIISIIFLFINKYIAIIPIIISIYLINKKEKNPVETNIASDFLQNEVDKLDNQINIYKAKIELLNKMLINCFGEDSITYIKYMRTIHNITNLFYSNIDTIKDNFKLVDEKFIIKHKKIDKPLKDIYKLFNDNEIIIEKINNLLIEIKKINPSNQNDIDLLIEELEIITKNTKMYKEV